MKTIERTPHVERESSPHKRQRANKRPYKIEGRYIGKSGGLISQLLGREWRVVGAYENERSRLNAWRSLKKNTWWSNNHEYRLCEMEASR